LQTMTLLRPGRISRNFSPVTGTWQLVAPAFRLDARELDHFGPFVDIFGDETGELVRRVRRHRYGPEISKPLLDIILNL